MSLRGAVALSTVFSTAATLCAVESKNDPDVEYVSGLCKEEVVWKDEMPDPEQTNIQIDIPRVQALATDLPRGHMAWFVLAAVKNPSQLDFLVRAALKLDYSQC